MTILEIKDMTKYYGDHIVINNINLLLEKNIILNIFGPSGSGKTTLLRCIAGLEQIISGTIALNKKVVHSDSIYLPPNKRRINMVFQDLSLWPHMSVYRNINFSSSSRVKDSSIRKKWNEELLRRFQINHKKNDLPDELSGGEKQRVAIARAIASKPEILLLDEPFSQLDNLLAKVIRNELVRLLKDIDITIIVTSHDREEFDAYPCEYKTIDNGVLHELSNEPR